MISPKKIEVSLGNDIITIETGKLAKQADGAVTVKMKNAMLLATVVSNSDGGDTSNDFLPLTVDYREKFASSGRIPGGFIKREGPLSYHEILICRLVDRAIRPLFPDHYKYETQINIYLMSADETVMPDTLACIAASAALAVSDVPVEDHVAEVRVARIQEEWVINPSYESLENADIDLIVGGTDNNVLMVEGECREIAEEELLAAIQAAQIHIKELCYAQSALAEKAGPPEKRVFSSPDDNELTRSLVEGSEEGIKMILENEPDKATKNNSPEELYERLALRIPEEVKEESEKFLMEYFEKAKKKLTREMILNKERRPDGRMLEEIRPIDCETDYLPAAHGSAIFTRGETQSLTTVTFGSSKDVQLIDGATYQGSQNFMLQYNFPGFSTGDIKFNRGPGRREIGHSHLAQRSFKQMVPTEFPYTIRVVSDILESNGSSSMATVCAGSLALMDAGVPVKAAVSGVAMGLIIDGENFAVLSDISAEEDHIGDMDFKVTGTREGICACQMDLKTRGIPFPVMLQALKQAREARLAILDKMDDTIAAPRPDLKPHVSRIERIEIPKEYIGAVIGPGGKVIQELQASTGTTISIKEEAEIGCIEIFAPNEELLLNVKNRIKMITAEPDIGTVYTGVVKDLKPFGAFVEFMPGKDGLLHISEIREERVEKIEDALQTGMEIKVKVIDIDPKTGKTKLSAKALERKSDPEFVRKG